MKIGLIGDFDPQIVAHLAIPRALAMAAEVLGEPVTSQWLATDRLGRVMVEEFDGLWVAPGGPYRDGEAVVDTLKQARLSGVPVLGTCAGFQHGVLEFARHALGMADAVHAEWAPQAGRVVIAPLACALRDTSKQVRLLPGSRLARAYASVELQAEFNCSYGLAPELAQALEASDLKPVAWAGDGQVLGFELAGHRFFCLTLFQPERAALNGRVPPAALALLEAAQVYRHSRATALATTPLPPYTAVVFSSRRAPYEAGYNACAERMIELAREQPGFISVESARGLDGLGLTVSYWADEASAAAWQRDAEHLAAQRLGKAVWYSDYRVRILRCEREYGPAPLL
ncbi:MULTISPECIES: antibiotic biosynthesis monooxygenase [unclassified Pseudomonas]|uniref:antibiotic biosynthesis monooxygenase n=1 Tax=unclassified Pseudomonas TaxID=196821 RepID=UPI000BCCC10C|nr:MULTISPECIES: antibiotic biosynthesis monooxygenase [unclassified Pseudomonas]PVZ13526.1 antibiotic biosynthesis monooxygenase [Pseudomonas sp. URIL14HWK12:I12]PVZ23832.1 antibiotic biosynthesis monooxygenase [Pseudomonas sp. URIL14HWK12:I10]PVZ33529.1 antibiotic biosynthesis monooxygenase [Pseudomonas sp. URIL14HWK12:I11]SNZ11928.1 CTP synthase (UTP-ammonia lyase) [Pseudomonas sp. URIL14HWK12:I9]